MRIKGRKYISLVLMLMFLVSFFPGYSLAGETDGQGLLSANEIIQSDLNYSDSMDESLTDPPADEPEELPEGQPVDEPGEQPVEAPAGELVGDLDEQPTEPADITQQVAALEEAAVSAELTVNYVLLGDNGDRVPLKSLTVPDLTSGNTVKGTDLLTSEYESMQFLYSEPEELILAAGENTIALLYEEELVGANPDNLSEFSTGITPAEPFYYPPAQRMMLMTKMLLTGESGPAWPAPGAINLQKKAEPVEGTENQWKVTLTIEGKNIQTTSDVVLVIDRSGSMSGNKMDNTKLAAKEFVDKLLLTDGATRIAVVSFNSSAQVVSQFTDYSGKDGLKTAIEDITATGGTNIQAGIRQAQVLLDASPATNKVMVLLGDGEPTYSYQVTGASGITLTGHSGSYGQNPNISYNNPQITAINYNNLVGSGNSYTISSSGRYQIPCSEWGHGGSHATTFPANNGIPTIYEAGLARSAGTQIYSVALNAGSNGEYVLDNCQNKGYYQLNSSDLTALSGVFSQIAGSIAYAASSGTVIDPMGDMFDLVSIEEQITLSQGSVTIDPINTINWNVGNIVEGTNATMSYIVQIKDGAEADALYPTNDTTTFDYTNVYGDEDSKDFPVPEVSIGGGSILIKGYLVNDAGQPINAEGVAVDRPDLAKRLFDSSYSGAPLAYNVTYDVTQPGYSGHQYVKYVWDLNEGPAETVSILLQASAPTQTVWFGYKEISYHTVTWVDEDGTTELGTEDFAYGSTAAEVEAKEPADPTKAADAQYTYSFAGWTPAYADVTGNQVYTATYSKVTNNYKVTWVDEDGTTELGTEDFAYGSTAAEVEAKEPADPTKAADAQYTYSFAGWTPAYADVTGNQVYTATYSKVTNNYKVTWVDEDGTTELGTEDFAYGSTAAEVEAKEPADPIKAADAQYTYSFAGWTPAYADVTGNQVYTATYSKVTNNYKVTWVDEDGTTELGTEDFAYGSTAAEVEAKEPADPTKAADAQYTYSFAGWTPAYADVTGNQVYTATYSKVTNNYKVTWVDEDGTTELGTEDFAYGSTAAEVEAKEPADPTKAADAQYTYSFAGWTPAYADVTGNQVYTATYSKVTNNYKVTWVDEDGTTELGTEDFAYGSTAAEVEAKEPADPTKAADAQYTYSFAGWTPAYADVTGNQVYTATYSKVTNNYKVTWVDEDGTTELGTEDFAYGSTAAEVEAKEPADPTKAADAQYTYSFAGWTPAYADVTGNQVYTATYSKVTNNYKVTWVDEDGTTELGTEDFAYGSTAAEVEAKEPADPIKAADAQYTYSFAGWTPAYADVTGNQVYTATYSKVTNNYKVTWVDEDGTTELGTEDFAYGSTAAEVEAKEPADPTKAADAQYTYSFAGWTPAYADVTGNQVYTATYSKVTNNYKVTWVDEDGTTELGTEDFAYGSTAAEVEAKEPADPTKAADAQYTYSFAGWTPAYADVTGNQVYTATYSKVTNNYKVTWVDEDGTTELGTEDFAYGSTAAEVEAKEPADPTKAADAQYTYSFAGWTPAYADVTGNQVYTATYSKVTNNYKVTWVDEDGTTELGTEDFAYGSTAAEVEAKEPADPTKAADAQYTYSFAGWTPAYADVTGNQVYTATYSKVTNNYKVTWVDEDGTTELGTEDFAYGSTAAEVEAKEPADPIKAADAQYTYSFAGWTPAYADVTGNQVYTATYSKVTNNYKVTWVDEDGTTELGTEDFAYGSTAAEVEAKEPADPTKAADAQYTYSFAGWTPAYADVTGNQVYTATYSKVTNNYKVTWVDEDGTTELGTEDFAYGSTAAEVEAKEPADPTKAADAQYTYSFAGWTPAYADVTGNQVYTATYSKVTNNYKVTWVDEDGTTELGTEDFAYGSTAAEVEAKEPADPTKAADAQYTYSFAGWTPAYADVTGNQVYTATYSAVTNSYTVTYKITGNYFTDDEYATETYEFGAAVTAVATPSKAGYNFHGWTGVPETMPANDVTVTGYYTKSGGGGGGGGGGSVVTPEEPIEVPEEPEVAIPLNKEDHFAYIVGYPDNTVQPEGIITREEVAAVFYRLLDANYRETIKTTSNDFPDVGLDRWSSKHIGTLASVGIVVGYPDGTFRPGNSITRAEIATIASKFDKLSPFEDNRFSDIMGHWANQYINSAAQKGWVAGYPDGTFKPDQAITRAEFMTLVNNVLDRRVLAEDILPDARQFPDLLESEWYYEEVQEAINSHYYERTNPKDYEIWTQIYYPELDM